MIQIAIPWFSALGAATPMLLPSGSELLPFAGAIVLFAGIVAVLLTPLLSGPSNTLSGLVALLVSTIAAVCTLVRWWTAPASGQFFHGMLLCDGFSMTLQAIILLFLIGIVLLWFSTAKARFHAGDAAEFFTLLLGATLGMVLMVSTSNLLMLTLAVEMASLPSYVLAGFRKTDRLGAEASLKYVLFGAACSSLMIYGLSLLYGLYGTLSLPLIASTMAGSGAPTSLLLWFGVCGLLIGTGFKIAAVPFHFWCPDVFEGAAIDVAAFLSVASKAAGLGLLLRVIILFAHAANYQATALNISLALIIGILGTLTATLGNVAAFTQTNIKRLLAYSSIAHAGYMLCAISLVYRNSLSRPDPGAAAGQALLIYLAIYLLMNLGAFTAAAVVASGSQGNAGESIDAYRGLSRRAPLLAMGMAASLLSLIGLPPFGGFLAKLNLMVVLGAAGSGWWILVAVIGINTVASLYYYLRIVKAMYFEAPISPVRLYANPVALAVVTLCGFGLILSLVGFNILHTWAGRRGQMLLP